MAVLVSGFKVPDFLHFCRRFKKPSFFKKPTGAKKAEKPSIYFEKAGNVLASTCRRSRLKIEQSAGKRERDSLFPAIITHPAFRGELHHKQTPQLVICTGGSAQLLGDHVIP
jgi:hypothetical protein